MIGFERNVVRPGLRRACARGPLKSRTGALVAVAGLVLGGA